MSEPTHARAAQAGARTSDPATFGAAVAIVTFIVAVDQYTKHLAVTHLVPVHHPFPVLGDLLRFTLTFNPGAAFGMHLGEMSRWIFTTLTFVILGFLVRLYRTTPPVERTLRLSVATVMGGAIGNLIDRFRSPQGVVDFIDIGVGDTRFWTFNVADIAVSIGAVLLVVLLWRYESRLHAEQLAAQQGGAAGTPAGAQAGASLADSAAAER